MFRVREWGWATWNKRKRRMMPRVPRRADRADHRPQLALVALYQLRHGTTIGAAPATGVLAVCRCVPEYRGSCGGPEAWWFLVAAIRMVALKDGGPSGVTRYVCSRPPPVDLASALRPKLCRAATRRRVELKSLASEWTQIAERTCVTGWDYDPIMLQRRRKVTKKMRSSEPPPSNPKDRRIFDL